MSKISKENLSRIGPEESDKILASVISEIDQSERTLNPWKNKVVRYNELYKMIQKKKNYEGLANVFVPEILRAVETISANIYKAITGSNPWFEYLGREKDDEGSALAMTQLVNYQMDENGFKSKLMDSIRQMVISGVTVRKVLWDFQQVSRKGKKVVTNSVVDSITKKQTKNRKVVDNNFAETIRDHWTFEGVDLLGFHISDVNTPYHDIQKAKWMAEQYFVEEAWLREKFRKDWITDAYKEVLGSLQANNDSEYKRLYKDRNSANYNEESDRKDFEIIERWGLGRAKWVYSQEQLKQLNLDPEDLVETVIIICNRKFVLKLEANPFAHGQKPYLSCPYIPEEFNWAGMGAGQIGEKLQEELNDSRNQVMDNKTLNLMCMWLKSKGSGIKNSQLRVRPLGVIDTNDMNGLEPLRPPVLTGVGINIEGVVKNDLRESVGASSNLQGIAQAGVDTATESTIINREAFGRLAMIAEMYGNIVLKPMFMMIQYLNYQFYVQAKVIKVIGLQGIKFRKLDPDEIVGYKDVVIHLTTDVSDNPAVLRQQLIQFWTILQQMPPELIQFHWNMLDKIYKQFFPTGSLEDLYEAPQGQEELLTPEEENDLMINGTTVPVKKGDEDQSHLASHLQDFETFKYALSEPSFRAFTDHIAKHQAQLDAKLQAEQLQFAQQLMETQQSGGKLNRGQIKNASPFTNGEATKQGDLLKQTGAGV